MSKALRIRIFSFLLAAVLSFFGTAYSISIVAFAADTVKTWNDWDEVGEDAIALRDAYVKYLREVGEGDFIGALGKGVDVPIKWLKLLSDGRLVLSPCDDVIYFLKDNVLQSTRKQGKEADTGLASRLKPVIDGKTGKQLNDYWSEYYKPHENASQFIWSYQSTDSISDRVGSYYFVRNGPIYMDSHGSWGKKNWDGVYLLGFVSDDNNSGIFYSSHYLHCYSSSDSNGQHLVIDRYKVDSGILEDSQTIDNDYKSYPYISARLRYYSQPELFMVK